MLPNLLCCSSLLLSTFVQAAKVVKISQGQVQGTSCPNEDVTAFLGIPYAVPPKGNLRFAPPKANHVRFKGTYLAVAPPPACIQFGNAFLESGPVSEDCLYLNVWVPPNNSSLPLPVKVWVYGGSDNAGGISNPLYNGCNLAAQGNSIVVSVNYRLGPLGFLALKSAGIEGNMGIQDILLGLQWVRRHIGDFGGDKKKVLLFGQSAGSYNVHAIASLRQTPSLINGAICQSAAGRSVQTNSSMQTLGAAYAQGLGCSTSDISCLRNKSTDALNAMLPSSRDIVGISTPNATDFQPYIDGKIIPAQPSIVGSRVPIVFGSTTEEGTVFVLPSVGFNVLDSYYRTILEQDFGPEIASVIIKQYPISLYNSSAYPAFTAISTFKTYYDHLCPAFRGLRLATKKGIPAYTYLWGHAPTCDWYSIIPNDPATLKILGATHTVDLPFVFGNVDHLPLPDGKCNSTAEEKQISKTVTQSWTAMAQRKNPSIGGLSWPAYNLSMGYQPIGLNVYNGTSIGKIDYGVCEFWDRIAVMVERSLGVDLPA